MSLSIHMENWTGNKWTDILARRIINISFYSSIYSLSIISDWIILVSKCRYKEKRVREREREFPFPSVWLPLHSNPHGEQDILQEVILRTHGTDRFILCLPLFFQADNLIRFREVQQQVQGGMMYNTLQIRIDID